MNSLRFVVRGALALGLLLAGQDVSSARAAQQNEHYKDYRITSAFEGAGGYLEEVEKRKIERVGRVLQNLRQSQSLTRDDWTEESSTSVVFRFEGETIDEDLTDFYAFWTSHMPRAIRPVEVRRELVACGGDAACPTVSHAAFEYGLLARDFPERFEKEVIQPLSEVFGVEALPGLLLVPVETRRRIFFGKDFNAARLCRHFRFDGRDDCVLQDGGWFYIKGQGLTTEIRLPRDQAVQFLDAYEKSVSEGEGYRLGNISFFLKKALKVESAPAPTAEANAAADDPAVESTLAEDCRSKFNDDSLRQHVRQYRDLVFPIFGEAGEYTYPKIAFFDKFPSEWLIEGRPWWKGLDQADLTDLDLSPSNEGLKTACLESGVAATDHGPFLVSLLAARRNEVGITGLLPNIELDAIRTLNTPTLPDLLTLLPMAGDLDDSGRTVVANISVSDRPDNASAKNALRREIDGLQHRVLFVVAAGNRGEDLSKNCDQVPACFGDLPNVITVASLDLVDGGNPRIWNRSNRGPEVVSVAAPGVEIVATDSRFKKMSSAGVYLQSNGTSASAVFVTAVAARLVKRDPYIKPVKLKKLILAHVGPVSGPSPDTTQYLFGGQGRFDSGNPAPVAAGRLRMPCDGLEQDIVITMDGTKHIGEAILSASSPEFILFNRRYGGTRNERKCAKYRLLRLVQTSPNQFSMLCEGPTGELVAYDSLFLRPLTGEGGSAGMSCLYDPDDPCLTLKPSDPGKAPEVLRLEEIRDVLFAVRN